MSSSSPRTIALVGNPNSGKTTLFNAITGLRQKVGNYAGVTVERKEGRVKLPSGQEAAILDLPGTYSLHPGSPDERIVTEAVFGTRADLPIPDLVVCVVDASHLERNLYLASQIIDRAIPVIVALTMVDLAEEAGIQVNPRALSAELGVPVVPVNAARGSGLTPLLAHMAAPPPPSHLPAHWILPEAVERETEELVGLLSGNRNVSRPQAFHEAVSLLTAESERDMAGDFAPEILSHVMRDHRKLDFLGIDRKSVFVESRYAWIRGAFSRVTRIRAGARATWSDRIDAVATHPLWGGLLFFALMALLFQAVFTWSEIPMEWIRKAFERLSVLADVIPPGDLHELVERGGIAGVAAVVTFLPQILFLFLFLGLLEDTGYMARAAFIMDRWMSKIGLHGKSFIPLLSSFACAVPGIMATRTIENPRDRLATMLVAPLMSCSARLPVYALMIAAVIPATKVGGIVALPGLVLFSMYALGTIAALGMAWLLKKTVLKAPTPAFFIELPPYKMPSLRSILILLWERAWTFLKRAGTIILGASIILWFLATYPKIDHGTPAEKLQASVVGKAGKLIEPIIAPLGFDWRIGVGLVTSVIQREVFVSTMGTLYDVGGTGGDRISLAERLRSEPDPADPTRPYFTPLRGICVMIYYVLAMQCFSTVVVMRRETNGWRWPMFQIAYMTLLAYAVTLAAYHAGMWMGG
jgi:ferrous iron transport protein B